MVEFLLCYKQFSFIFQGSTTEDKKALERLAIEHVESLDQLKDTSASGMYSPSMYYRSSLYAKKKSALKKCCYM